MKRKIVLVVVSLLMAVGCSRSSQSQGVGCSLMTGPVEYRVMKIRDCEYVVASGGNEGIVHCGDCSNPIHRQARHAE